jgi:PAS domain-containing protein
MQNKTRGSAEDNFIALLNFIVDPAVIVNEKGRFLVINDAFTDLTGIKKRTNWYGVCRLRCLKCRKQGNTP